MSISSEEKDTSIQLLSEKLNQLKSKSSQLENENGNLSERNSILQRQLDELTEKLTKSLRDQRNTLNENVQLEKVLNEKNSSIGDMNKELATKEKELENFKQKLMELERKSNVKDTHTEAYEKQIMALKNRIFVLESSFKSVTERNSLSNTSISSRRSLERNVSDRSEHNPLHRVQESIDIIRNVSEKEVVKTNDHYQEQQLSEEVLRFLEGTKSRQNSSSDSVSSKEKVIEVHDYQKSDPIKRKEVDLKFDKQNKKITRRSKKDNRNKNSIKLKPHENESDFIQERIKFDQKFDKFDEGGYPYQISQFSNLKTYCFDKHCDHCDHCCTVTHKIPSECDCVCVCLPQEYHLCCTEITDEPLRKRFVAGKASIVKGIDSNASSEKKSSNTSFYMELLCESFESIEDSDYITFEEKLFSELKYKKFKKIHEKEKFQEMNKMTKDDLNSSMIKVDEIKRKCLSQDLLKLPLPPPFPNTI